MKNKQQNPLVSIIMNCYNGEQYLDEAIQSVIKQTYTNWELIFWDNQSIDKSAQIITQYKDIRIKYFYALEHTQLYAARNKAIKESSGEYIAFLDVDDYWEPQKLEKQMPLFKKLEIGLVCSRYWILKDGKKSKKIFPRTKIITGDISKILLKNYQIGMLTLVIRRAAFNKIGEGCDERFHIIGDLDLVYRISREWKIDACQEPLANYRIHGNNEGKRKKQLHIFEYKLWLSELRRYSEVIETEEYKSAQQELLYMEGSHYIHEGSISDSYRIFRDIKNYKFKFKLLIKIILKIVRNIIKNK